jgi:AAA15 family ATPase/GTPase
MLIEFTVGNFRSFRENVTFTMVAANLSSAQPLLDETNVVKVDHDLGLLKSAAIYGANGSGKSNLGTALRFVREFVTNSSKDSQVGESTGAEPFRLSESARQNPSFFELIFVLEGTKYRYGFEVDSKRVHSEWLYHIPSTKEASLFQREFESIKIGRSFREARGLDLKTRNNALFLSVVAQFNGDLSQTIVSWFEGIRVIVGLNDQAYRNYTLKMFASKNYSGAISKFLDALDLGFNELNIDAPYPGWSDEVEEIHDHASTTRSPSNGMRVVINPRVRTVHRSFDDLGKPVGTEYFDIDENESEGTKKLIFLAGPLMDALASGKILFIDELDARLHPLVTFEIIRLFHRADTNPNNAQLVFATHDINLLSNRYFRRDQIWFVEKDAYGASHLTSLVQFRVRKDASFERDYIKGKYGAIPFLGDFDLLVSNSDES